MADGAYPTLLPHIGGAWGISTVEKRGIMPLTGCVDDLVAGSETLPVGEEVAQEQQESLEQLGKELENEVALDEDQEQLEAPMSESA